MNNDHAIRSIISAIGLVLTNPHKQPRVEPEKPPTIEDLQPEYDLIMQKKSKLSRARRDGIVRVYTRLTKTKEY